MRFILFLLVFTISSCGTVPSYQFFSGGQTINQPGVSLILPEGKSWGAIIRSTYEGVFGAKPMPKNDTLIVAIRVYNAPPASTKEEFLSAIKKGRSSEPKTGRFEIIKSREELFDARSEVCVIHQSQSKDFGTEAKRGGEFSILETYGMNCIHPTNQQVGILVELSRKAPPNSTFSGFESMGAALLNSVIFGEF